MPVKDGYAATKEIMAMINEDSIRRNLIVDKSIRNHSTILPEENKEDQELKI